MDRYRRATPPRPESCRIVDPSVPASNPRARASTGSTGASQEASLNPSPGNSGAMPAVTRPVEALSGVPVAPAPTSASVTETSLVVPPVEDEGEALRGYTDKESSQLEKDMRVAAAEVYGRLKQEYRDRCVAITWEPKLNVDTIRAQYEKRGLSAQSVDDLPISGAAPDGGCFFVNGELALCTEAKKQNIKGNAIERWHKNHAMVQPFGRDVAYVTFCVGEGAGEDAVMSRILNPAMHNEDIGRIERGEVPINKQWNTAYNEGLSCYRRDQGGFSKEEQGAVMEGILRTKIERALRIDVAKNLTMTVASEDGPAPERPLSHQACPTCGHRA